MTEDECDHIMARLTIDYILLDRFSAYYDVGDIRWPRNAFKFRSRPGVRESGAFVKYSYWNWATHLQGKLAMNDGALLDKAVSLCDSTYTWDPVRKWFRRYYSLAANPPFPDDSIMDQHVAAYRGNDLVLERMYEIRPFDVNAKDCLDSTALHWAFRTKGEIARRVQRWLIQKGADANARDDWGDTAITSQFAKTNINAIKLMLDAGYEIDNADHTGLTALHEAVGQNDSNLVKLLIAHKVNLEMEDKHGNTALNLAITAAARTSACY